MYFMFKINKFHSKYFVLQKKRLCEKAYKYELIIFQLERDQQKNKSTLLR